MDALIASISGLDLSFGIPARIAIFWRRALPGGGFGLAAQVERFEVDPAPNRLRLDDVDDVAQLHLVVGQDGDRLVVGFDRRDGVLEIEAPGDLFARLVERIVELLGIDARDDVER